jgi:hypothetical protein
MRPAQATMPEPLNYERRHVPADLPGRPPLLDYATPRTPRRRTRLMPLVGALVAGGFALLFAFVAVVALHDGDAAVVAFCAAMAAYAGMWVRFAASSTQDR